MAPSPPRPKGARAGRVAFGSVGLAGSAAIVMALGPIWTPVPVSTEVLATPMRAVETGELLAAAEAETVTPSTTAPPVPTTAPEPEVIIVEVHRRVAEGTPGATDAAPVAVDPGSPVTRSAAAASVAGAAPAQAQAQAQAQAAAPTQAAAAAAPAAPAPAPTPKAAPAPPPPPPPPAPTAPPRTSASG